MHNNLLHRGKNRDLGRWLAVAEIMRGCPGKLCTNLEAIQGMRGCPGKLCTNLEVKGIGTSGRGYEVGSRFSMGCQAVPPSLDTFQRGAGPEHMCNSRSRRYSRHQPGDTICS
ncbi:hypothetical protein T4C_12373 [Trichinella pseudospiralis]|uniref:Uncharacterized protein n=1 Tax=Trichinella pseudospiralis TaxID=6337 RepID=A0A0V1JQ24_TRIPS|nr:hypothetical protein T4C_12373 [Trichinella pseudospiralis]